MIFFTSAFLIVILYKSQINTIDKYQYKAGLDALLESERIKEEIFHLEHDLWEY